MANQSEYMRKYESLRAAFERHARALEETRASLRDLTPRLTAEERAELRVPDDDDDEPPDDDDAEIEALFRPPGK